MTDTSSQPAAAQLQSRAAAYAADDGAPADALGREEVLSRANELAISLVATSSTPDAAAQQSNCDYLHSLGVRVSTQPVDVIYRHGIPSLESLSRKAQSLSSAWLAAESNAVFALRGGYGGADLLAKVDWAAIPAAKPLLGFSDVSAIHSAFYAQHGPAGGACIHGPMIGHGKCGHDSWRGDLDMAVGLLTGTIASYQLDALPLPQARKALGKGQQLSGPVFGGCLAVLTGLIGTPFFPRSLADHILFFEDVGENLHRLVRLISQWQLSGALEGVRGIMLGIFADCGEDASRRLGEIIEERTGLPCWIEAQFGHVQPNMPVIIGREATLTESGLRYHSLGALLWSGS